MIKLRLSIKNLKTTIHRSFSSRKSGNYCKFDYEEKIRVPSGPQKSPRVVDSRGFCFLG